jgi:hypothetical protein
VQTWLATYPDDELGMTAESPRLHPAGAAHDEDAVTGDVRIPELEMLRRGTSRW